MFGMPYGRRVLGFHDALNFDGDTLRDVYRSQYNLGNMALIVAGPNTPEQVDEMVRRYFDITAGERTPHVHPATPELGEAGISGMARDEANNVRISVSYPLPSALVETFRSGAARYSVAASAMKQACFELLRYEYGISYNGSIGISNYNHPNAWYLGAHVTTDAEHIGLANQAISSSFAKPGSDHSADEIQASIAKTQYQTMSTADNPLGRTDYYEGRLEMYFEPHDPSDLVERYKAVTPDEVRAAIDEFSQLARMQPRFEHRTGPKRYWSG